RKIRYLHEDSCSIFQILTIFQIVLDIDANNDIRAHIANMFNRIVVCHATIDQPFSFEIDRREQRWKCAAGQHGLWKIAVVKHDFITCFNISGYAEKWNGKLAEIAYMPHVMCQLCQEIVVVKSL